MSQTTVNAFLYRRTPDSPPVLVEVSMGHVSEVGESGWRPLSMYPGAFTKLAPEPDKPSPDWSQAPEWANWWAVDAEGVTFWYEQEPICVATVTYCGWHPKCINGIQQGEMAWIDAIDIPLGIDWRTTLTRRPVAQATPTDAGHCHQ